MKYMGEKGDEEQLTAFLNIVLQRAGNSNISSITIVENKALSAEIIGGKACVLDLRAVMTDGTKINIEVQLRNLSNMERRSLFYWGREYTSGIDSGQDYLELEKVIVINIIDFDLMPDLNEVHSCFHLWEDHNKNYLMTDVLEIHFVNMYKFRKLKEKDIENNPLYSWLAFFSKETDEETLKKIIEMNTAIKKAHEKVMLVSCDAETLRLYNMREQALMDYVSGVNQAHREGMAIGKQEGRQEGRQEGKQEALSEYVSKLSRKGKSIEEISDLTDLPVEAVKGILDSE
jgi:predicted transposase/invertase (TIGR01784 family)